MLFPFLLKARYSGVGSERPSILIYSCRNLTPAVTNFFVLVFLYLRPTLTGQKKRERKSFSSDSDISDENTCHAERFMRHENT